MITEIIPFEFDDHDLRAIRDEHGNPWFVARDACAILGLDNVSMAIEKLDDDEKMTSKVLMSGVTREVWMINEFGLYELLFRSNKPEAKRFRRWLSHEVIPSIRKTGGYLASWTDADLLKMEYNTKKLGSVSKAFASSIRLAQSMGISGFTATRMANRLTLDTIGVDCMALMGLEDRMGDIDAGGARKGKELLMDILHAKVEIETGSIPIRIEVIEALAHGPEWEHADALQIFGLKVLPDGLFLHCSTVQQRLLSLSEWVDHDVRALLLTLSGAKAVQLRLNGNPVRGVSIPFTVEHKTVTPVPEVIQ